MRNSLLTKVSSVALVIIMILVLFPINSLAAQASERYAIETLFDGVTVEVDNEFEYVIKEVTSEGTTISTNNRVSHMLFIEKFDNAGNLLSISEIDLYALETGESDFGDLSRATSSQYTFSNREYYVNHSTGYWKIRSGDNNKIGYEKNVNSTSYLESFREHVEEINSAELALIGVVGGTLVVAVVAGLLTGGVGAAIAAAEGIAGASAAIAILSKCINNADYYYNKVKFS